MNPATYPAQCVYVWTAYVGVCETERWCERRAVKARFEQQNTIYQHRRNHAETKEERVQRPRT